MRPFSLLIKPASASCNLSCDYCFYLEKSRLFSGTQPKRMNDAILERIIRTYLQTRQPNYTFSWQGGEPTLMGLDFFRQAVAYQNHFRPRGARIMNALQTNGTLVTSEWAEFLARNQFLVGVSLDGPERIHNTYRTYQNNLGSFADVRAGIRNLQQNKVDFNVLTLVSQANVRKPREVYRYIKDEIGCYFHQYIECVEFQEDGTRAPYAIDALEWGEFLCEIFDEWLTHDSEIVSVRLFDSIMSALLGQPPTLCSFGNDCRHYLVIEHNGDVFPCDFYVENDLKLGNIAQDSWQELLLSRKYEQFGLNKRKYHEECCSCEYLPLCAGDCQKNRVGAPRTSEVPKSSLCAGWKMFYTHSLPAFKKLARKAAHRQNEGRSVTPTPHKISRNDPCICGSGKKYKKCCLNK